MCSRVDYRVTAKKRLQVLANCNCKEYTELKDRCMIEPTVLYIHENHEFLSEFKYFANADGLEVKIINGDTRIC